MVQVCRASATRISLLAQDVGRMSRAGAVTDLMRRIKARYHYTIRRVRKDESRITREKFAHALIDSNSRMNFWDEI